MAGESQSSGTSFNESQSTSTPVAVNTAQSDWGLMQSQLLTLQGQMQRQWAMEKIAKGENITDQTVANFLEMSGRGRGLADTILHQYSDQIKPLMDQWIREAGSYASEGRQRFEAGQAMSTVAQADEAAMSAMKTTLGNFGVNVNSGRFQDMLSTARIMDAQARAQAGTKAAQDTEATGRQMTAQAINWGQNMPGQAINAIQSSYAGLTGAENAILGFLNTAKDLSTSDVPYHQTAVAANKLPPVGQNTQSSSVGGSQQQSTSQQRDPPQREGGGGGEKQPGQGKGPGGGKGAGDGEGRTGMGIAKSPSPGAPGGSGREREEDEEEYDPGTGEAEDGYYGTVPYYDADGNLMPQWSPDTFETGKEFGPDTPQWEGEKAPNWSLPPEYSNNVGPGGLNVDPAAMTPGTQWNLDATWPDTTPVASSPLENWNTAAANIPDASEGPGTDPDFPAETASYDEDPWGGQDFTNYDDTSAVDDNDYDFTEDTSDETYDLSDSEDVTDYGDYDDSDYSDYEDDSYYDDYEAQGDYGEDDQSYYDDADYEDNSYYDDWESSGGYEDDGGYYDDGGYGGEEFSGASEDYYAQGGRVRRPPPGMRRPGGPPPQRPMPKPNGALSQRPMLRRPSRQPGVLPTTGGAVPKSASPSQGRQTDDISARLNAGEYVIPRDVVKHQGTKFFTDLIQKSRKLRTGMAGEKPKPTLRPALPAGRPTFSSRSLPPR